MDMDLLVEECCHSLLLSHPAGAWIEQEEVSREALGYSRRVLNDFD